MSNIEFIVVKGNKFWDMSNLVSSVRWSGCKGAAARSILVNFIDDDGYDHDRTGIDVEKGHQCIFRWKGKELFRGMFMRQEQSRSKMMPVMAYNRIYSATGVKNQADTASGKNVKIHDAHKKRKRERSLLQRFMTNRATPITHREVSSRRAATRLRP